MSARVVDDLTLLNRLSAKCLSANHKRIAIGIHEHLERDVQLFAIAEDCLMHRGYSRGTGVEITVCADISGRLLCTIDELDGRSVAYSPVPASGSIPGLQHSALESGFAQFICRNESRDTSTKNDNSHTFARIGRQVDGRRCRQRFR